MINSELVVGRRYGMRLKVSPGEPLIEVKHLEKVGRKGHVKIEHFGGETPGLSEYVKTRQLIVAWGERKAFLRDEERLDRTERASAKEGTQARRDATETIRFATGEPEAGLLNCALLSMSLEAAEQIAARAKMTEPLVGLHPAAFVNRFGAPYLPYDGAEKLAMAFAAAEPETVLLFIQDQEAEYKARGNEPGSRYLHDILREKSGGFALARQWAGHEQEVDGLQEEIDRLRSLVSMAAYDLERAGAEREAKRLRRALKGM